MTLWYPDDWLYGSVSRTYQSLRWHETPYSHASLSFVESDWNDDLFLTVVESNLSDVDVYTISDLDAFADKGLDIYWFRYDGDISKNVKAAIGTATRTRRRDLLRIFLGHEPAGTVCTTFVASCLGLDLGRDVSTLGLLKKTSEKYLLRKVWSV